ncbi:VacJ family lipoprotein [Limibaculum sp. M0105]|uniref:VacJ family lipoprotein n=1 Tax=Thermohalobaculum xanthum TaxID=2753746 RepID=A0A8J7M3W8_9RHOB|nr:VacJ family lipoprotein [Thermohalobaculum xanthum]MBK0397729.1 VacJ family lipoprotein [Thermohalobaculum xanthum]
MKVARLVSRVVSGIALMALAACASVDPEASFAEQDPYESTNRVMHDVNLAIDRGFLRPVAKGYDFVTPATVQHMLGNGFSHLDLPVDMVNHFLQGEGMAGLRTLGRFTLNTVLGMGGLLDPATEFGLPREQTDFGITLGRWGSGQGAYLVLPLIGPSTPRDFGGYLVDLAFSPQTYMGVTGSDLVNTFSLPLNALERVDTRNRNADLIDELLYESPDSYVTLRSVYLQRRNAQISRGDATEALPDIFEEEEPEEAPAAPVN